MNPLLLAFIQQILIPEIAIAVRAHYAATGKLPTDAEVFAALGVTTTAGIQIGQAWLDAHPLTSETK